jgi:hypothetical protein
MCLCGFLKNSSEREAHDCKSAAYQRGFPPRGVRGFQRGETQGAECGDSATLRFFYSPLQGPARGAAAAGSWGLPRKGKKIHAESSLHFFGGGGKEPKFGEIDVHLPQLKNIK